MQQPSHGTAYLLWELHGQDPLEAPPGYDGRCDACTHFTDDGGRTGELISPGHGPRACERWNGDPSTTTENRARGVTGHTCACVLSLKLSRVPLSATLWTITRQAPLPLAFPKQEYWSGLRLHSPGDLPHPRIEPASPAPLELTHGFLATEPPGKPFLARRNTNWQSSIDIDTLPCVK